MVRTYKPEDLDKIKEITVICFEGVSIDHNIEKTFGQFAETDWKARKAAHMDEDATVNPEGIFVWEENGEVIGYITTRLFQDALIGQIPNISVLPGHQGKGIGKALMKAAFDYFDAQGMKVAKIETLDQNDVGQNFYPSTGFKEVARQIHYAMPLSDRKI
jgi:ribosomal protein S18 acetylase RimI-like enzyme